MMLNFARLMRWAGLLAAVMAGLSMPAQAADLPIFDAHIHYSHDAWQVVPPREAVALLRKAGLRKAMVSSSSDEGTQLLVAEAPDLIVPSLRPYRSRGEIGTWVRDESVIRHLESRLSKFQYAAIGEFHVYGADADLPVMRRLVELAKQYRLLMHLHGDADAVERVFKQDPQARILWAHAGFAAPDEVRATLRRHRMLWADLAFRSDPGSGSTVNPAWRAAFEEFPDRFMLGTDTFSPERWWYVTEHAAWARAWLADLPTPLAERIAYRNAEAMLSTRPVAQSQAYPGTCPTVLGSKIGRLLQGDGLDIAWRAVPASIAVGKPFSIEFEVCPRGASSPIERLSVDAWMPDHRHGMNYRPTLTGQAPSVIRADGLVFHMPGRWQLVFEAAIAGRTLRLTEDVTVR